MPTSRWSSTMIRRPHAANLLLIAFGVAGTFAQDTRPTRQGIVREVASKLESLAAWGGEQHLPFERDATYVDILKLEPDNATARKALMFVRERGAWRQSSSYQAPKPGDPKRPNDYRRKRDEATSEFVDRALD